MQIDASSISMHHFLKREKERYETLDDIELPANDEMNDFIGIRARMNYRYSIINDILIQFKNLRVFKYYDDGSMINSVEMDLSDWNARRLQNDFNNDNGGGIGIGAGGGGGIGAGIPAPNLLHISTSAAITHVKFISTLRQHNGCIKFPESLEFISLINCDCLLDFSECKNILGLHLYGINHQQIHKWPHNNIIQCLVTSTQTEMTEEWNDIFEQSKYRLNHKYRSILNNNSYQRHHHQLPSIPTMGQTMPLYTVYNQYHLQLRH